MEFHWKQSQFLLITGMNITNRLNWSFHYFTLNVSGSSLDVYIFKFYVILGGGGGGGLTDFNIC